MPFNRKTGLAAVSAGLLIFILVYLFRLHTYTETIRIQDQIDTATIDITLTPGTMLFGDPCLTLSWQLDFIESVYINQEGRPGYGSEEICPGRTPVREFLFEINLTDGQQHQIIIGATVFFGSQAGVLAAIAVSLLLYICSTSLNLLPGPVMIWQSVVHGLSGSLNQLRENIRTENRLHLLSLFSILILGFALRLIYLNQPIRLDEYLSWLWFSNPNLDISSTLARYPEPNNHVLNTLLSHYAMVIFNTSAQWAMRMPVFISGILLIPLTYLTTRSLYNRHIALISAAFIAVYGPLILYSTNARGYMLMFVAIMLLVWATSQLLRRQSIALWLLFIFSTFAGFIALPIMLYSFVGVFLWLLASFVNIYRKTKNWRPFYELIAASACAAYLVLLGYLPVFGYAGIRAVFGNQWVVTLPFDTFVESLHLFPYYIGSLFLDGLDPLLVIGSSLMFLLGLLWHRHNGRTYLPVLLPLLLGTLIVMVIQRPRPYFATGRVYLYIMPFALMIISAGLYTLIQKFRPGKSNSLKYSVLISFAVALIFGYASVNSRMPYLSNEGIAFHFQAAMLSLRDKLEPGDRFLTTVHSRDPIAYYVMLWSIDWQHMGTDFDQADRIYYIDYVKDRTIDETLTDLLTPEIRERFGPPIILQDYQPENVRLYLLERL